jgi:hypothetical protein
MHLFKNTAMEDVNDLTFERDAVTTALDLGLMQALLCPQVVAARAEVGSAFRSGSVRFLAPDL